MITVTGGHHGGGGGGGRGGEGARAGGHQQQISLSTFSSWNEWDVHLENLIYLRRRKGRARGFPKMRCLEEEETMAQIRGPPLKKKKDEKKKHHDEEDPGRRRSRISETLHNKFNKYN